MKRLLLIGLVFIAGGLGWAIAQNVLIQALSGSETLVVGSGTGGPAGQGFYTNVSALRGGQNYALIVSGGTFTTTISPNIERVIFTSAATTANISLPNTPFDGQWVSISCPGGPVATVTVQAPSVAGFNPGPTVTGSAFTACNATPTASQAATWVFTTGLSPATWLRVQ